MQCTVRFTVYFTFNLLEKIEVLIQVKIIIKAEYMNSNYNAVRTFKKTEGIPQGPVPYLTSCASQPVCHFLLSLLSKHLYNILQNKKRKSEIII